MCWVWSSSSLIGNLTSQLPTMFWILKSLKTTSKPSFWIILAYFLAASKEFCSLLAPVTTIFPIHEWDELRERNSYLKQRPRQLSWGHEVWWWRRQISIHGEQAGKSDSYTLGLYSAFLAFKAICLRSSLQLKLTVETIFLAKN